MNRRSLGLCATALVAVLLALPCRGAAQTPVEYVTLDEVKRQGFEDVIGPIDDSIKGYFSVVQRFSFVNSEPGLSAFLAQPAGFPQFREFSDEARATVDGVPFPSGSTSVAYTYDEKLDTWVRWNLPMAPALSQNAFTNGRGVLTIGAAYSYVDYSHFNDQPLRRVAFSAGDVPVDFVDGSSGRVRDVLLSEVSLREHVAAFSVQFGVLDNLDVGVFVPVIDLHFRGNAVDRFFIEDNQTGRLIPANVDSDGEGGFVFDADPDLPTYARVEDVDRAAFGNFAFAGIRHDEDKTGVGDLQLRLKYFFGKLGPVDAGMLLSVLTPSGDEDNLLGVGNWRFQPRLILSSSQPYFATHVNLGFYADADDHDRDRFDYAVGGELRLHERVTLLVDQVGRLGYFGDTQVRKFEIVPGIKVNVFENAVIGFNAIVPLNREGLTTDFTPNAVIDGSIVF